MSGNMKLAASCIFVVSICIRLSSGQMDILSLLEQARLTHQKSLYLSAEFAQHSEVIRRQVEHIAAISDKAFAQSFVSTLESYAENTTVLPHMPSGRFTNVSETCLNHSLAIFQGLLNGETWSINMLDALGKLPSGVLEGDFMWLGGFSQCRSITAIAHHNQNGSQVSTDLFKGQYCLASIANGSSSYVPNPASPPLRIGLCVPDSCSNKDVTALVNTVLHPLPEDIIATMMDCKSESLSLDTPAYGVIALLSVLAAIIMCGTCYDVIIHRPRLARLSQRLPVKGVNESAASGSDASTGETLPTGLTVGEYTPLLGSQGQAAAGGEAPSDSDTAIQSQVEQELNVAIRLLLCFSVLANGQKILTVRPGNSTTLQAIHGVRFLSMSWVILGHSFVFALANFSNILFAVDEARGFAFQAILNASVSVDSFFLLSGTLMSYLLLLEMKKKGGPRGVRWLLVYFHRFWRLTPPYMLIIGIYTTLLRYTSSGPLWPELPDAACQKAWWANLLYVNNFDVANGSSCIAWTWYLANDMQFFIISPIILVVMFKTVIGGMVLVGLTMAVNVVVVAVLTYQNNLIPDFPGYLADGGNADAQNKWFADIYIKPWCRIGPYAVGLVLGYVLARTGRNVRLPWLAVAGGWAAAIACNLAVLYGLYNVANGHALTPGVSAFYASTHRIVWAAGLAWLIFACANGYGGPINSVLSWSALVPLSRLTYMAYLVHPIVMSWYYASQEALLHFNSMNLTYLFLGHIVMSYGVAFVASVTLEAPMMALEKVLLPRH